MCFKSPKAPYETPNYSPDNAASAMAIDKVGADGETTVIQDPSKTGVGIHSDRGFKTTDMEMRM